MASCWLLYRHGLATFINLTLPSPDTEDFVTGDVLFRLVGHSEEPESMLKETSKKCCETKLT